MAVLLLVGVAGSVMLAVGGFVDLPISVILAARVMVLSASVAAFVIVWRDARASGTGWFRAARRALEGSFRLFFDLLW
jgi:hypothetical protein